MGQIVAEDILVIIEIILLMYFIIRIVRSGDAGRSRVALLFVFGCATFVITDLYWLTHLLVKSGLESQFTAAEIGIAGMFLLYGAAMSVAGNRDIPLAGKDKLVLAGTIIFVAVISACWYGWNGGWIRDLITGLAMGYFLFVSVRGLCETEAISSREWVLSGILAALLLIFEVWSIFAKGSQVLPIEICRYTLWTAGLIFLTIKSLQAFRSEEPAEQEGEDAAPIITGQTDTGQSGAKALYLTFTTMSWCVFIMYLSTGLIYDISQGLSVAVEIPMYLAIRKEARQI